MMVSRRVGAAFRQHGYFLLGLAAGLCAALALAGNEAACDEPGAVPDEADAGAAGPGRAVLRPRYYRSELGMRESVLVAVLTSPDALSTRAAALNESVGSLVPLRFFTPTGKGLTGRLGNVVAFTDRRRLLLPFHVLKYLSDNYLEQYNYFLLLGDSAVLNARRLVELVEGISISQDVYMGISAADSQYCALETGILISNSVLRSVQASLDWCVRNSFSAQHHENIGRCVTRAASLSCVGRVQGQSYPAESLARSVTALPGVLSAERLEAALLEELLNTTREQILAASPTAHAWPAGVRADSSRHLPADRFDESRWVWFNMTHALMFSELEPATPLPEEWARAAREVEAEVSRWAEQTGGGPGRLVEGLWRWRPAEGLCWRVLLRQAEGERHLELCRVLGAPRLLPLPHVTESRHVTVLLPARAGQEARVEAFLARHKAMAARGVSLTVLLLKDARPAVTGADTLRWTGEGDEHAALRWAVGRLRDALLLVATPDTVYGEEFLNRVRMNTVAGHTWFRPLPAVRALLGGKARFLAADVWAAHGSDLAGWTRGPPEERLAGLTRLEAPEPGLQVRAPPPACRLDAHCLQDLRARNFPLLHFGDRQALAVMLMQDWKVQ